jgi:hypothetical protein
MVLSLSIFTILELPFLHHSHPDSTKSPQVSPVAPFLVAGSVSATTLVVFSAFFAYRVGLLNMESAEEQRARHKGIKRVSVWVTWMQRMQRGMVDGGWWMNKWF